VLQQSAEQQGGPGIPPLSPGQEGRRAQEGRDDRPYAQRGDLVHSYILLSRLIQQAINRRLGMQLLDPGRRVRLNFGDYLKPGDSLGVDIELPTNRLLAMAVASYLDSPDDAIAVNVTMSVLPDGTIYAARTVLDAKAKGLNVTVENTGYRRIAPDP
jgi:hypothetical protein